MGRQGRKREWIEKVGVWRREQAGGEPHPRISGFSRRVYVGRVEAKGHEVVLVVAEGRGRVGMVLVGGGEGVGAIEW